MADEGSQGPSGDSGPRGLADLLDRIAGSRAGEERVSIEGILEELGRRPFGAVLLLAGVITIAPVVGDIPGVPTTMAVLVLLTSGQLFVRRRSLWLPGWLVRRSVQRRKVETAVDKLKPAARFIDRLLRPRLGVLVRGVGTYGVAAACLLVGLAMPPMEFIPFSANLAGAALLLYGLGLVAGDGLLALAGHLFTGGVVAVLVLQF